ncbi:MAG: sel1 repeat family protein [Alphaproteobacteria bacterium]|nr:sel1 repeat family protein [Alphaproteobacteria bacterium]
MAWKITNVPDDAKAAAREGARRAGVPVGAWVSERILSPSNDAHLDLNDHLVGLLKRLCEIEKRDVAEVDGNLLRSLQAELARVTPGVPDCDAPEQQMSGAQDESTSVVEWDDGDRVVRPPPLCAVEEASLDDGSGSPAESCETPVAAVQPPIDVAEAGAQAAYEPLPPFVLPRVDSTGPRVRAPYLLAARQAAGAAQPAEAERFSFVFADRLPREWLERRRTVLAAVAVLVLVVCGGAASWMLSGRDSAAEAVQPAMSQAQVMQALHDLETARNPAALAAAVPRLEKAAAQGEPIAQFRLAKLYASGRGVVRDEPRAARLYALAAEAGNRSAMYDLAVALVEGRGLRANPDEAARWFLKAAQLGLVDAQFNLAVMYERGMGTPQSAVEAYRWYAIAAQSGDRQAAKRAALLDNQLTTDERQAALAEVRTFKVLALNVAANFVGRP